MLDILAGNRRLIILRALDESGYAANEHVLKPIVNGFGHNATRDMVRADLTYLAEHGLVRLEKVPGAEGEIWVAHLLPAGQEVAQGRVYPGIARREPG
jgi:hypothetical protein